MLFLTPSGKPDFNGIWQVMMNANDNLEPAALRRPINSSATSSRAPSRHCSHGSSSAVPASFGVVEGGTIPYKAEALARRDENAANWLERDPEEVLHARCPRATHAPPVPDFSK